MSFFIRAACVSNKGKIRSNNEDNFYFNGLFKQPDQECTPSVLTDTVLPKDRPIFAVFDGIGGENYGEAASFTAAQNVAGWLSEAEDDRENPLAAFSQLGQYLNKAVVLEKLNRGTEQMGCTMVAVGFLEDCAVITNLGDSPALLFRDGKLSKLSEDHAEPGYMIRGRLRKGALTQYLGIDPREMRIEPYVRAEKLVAGDRFILCSDGLTDMVSYQAIEDCLSGSASAESAANALLEAALAEGGRDNITICVCEVVNETQAPVMEQQRKRNGLLGKLFGAE